MFTTTTGKKIQALIAQAHIDVKSGGAEQYGRRRMGYLHVKTMEERAAVEKILNRTKHKATANYSPGSPRIEFFIGLRTDTGKEHFDL